MENIEKFIHKKWYFQGFNAVPTLLYGPVSSMVSEMPALLGYGYRSCVYFFEKDICYYLYDWKDLHTIHDEFFAAYHADSTYLSYLLKENKKICISVSTRYAVIGKIDWKEVTIEELVDLWKEVNNLYAYLLSVSHIVEAFTLTTEDEIRERFRGIFPNDFVEKTVQCTLPTIHSYMTREQYYLAKICRDIIAAGSVVNRDTLFGISESIEESIKHHTKQFFWKLNSYTSAKILTVEDFKEEIIGMLRKYDIDKIITDYESLQTRIEQKNVILETIKDKKLLELINISDIFFEIHDKRKELMTQSVHYLDFLLREIARRHCVSISDLRYICSTEFGQLPDIMDELQKRRKQGLFVTFIDDSEKVQKIVFSGDEAKKYIYLFKKHLSIQSDIKEIVGNCASKGVVTGTVKVCRGEKEISKVENGDILVACMTQPEFLPAMKKASAIITDEGGLTCHAAIVSREMGIPCVIGTKIATKVLKDGDVVEVDATRGIVKIIK
jgi:phosphohistidine swiveling domain-containing protein